MLNLFFHLIASQLPPDGNHFFYFDLSILEPTKLSAVGCFRIQNGIFFNFSCFNQSGVLQLSHNYSILTVQQSSFLDCHSNTFGAAIHSQCQRFYIYLSCFFSCSSGFACSFYSDSNFYLTSSSIFECPKYDVDLYASVFYLSDEIRFSYDRIFQISSLNSSSNQIHYRFSGFRIIGEFYGFILNSFFSNISYSNSSEQFVLMKMNTIQALFR